MKKYWKNNLNNKEFSLIENMGKLNNFVNNRILNDSIFDSNKINIILEKKYRLSKSNKKEN